MEICFRGKNVDLQLFIQETDEQASQIMNLWVVTYNKSKTEQAKT